MKVYEVEFEVDAVGWVEKTKWSADPELTVKLELVAEFRDPLACKVCEPTRSNVMSLNVATPETAVTVVEPPKLVVEPEATLKVTSPE